MLMGKHHNAISKIHEKEGVKISENSICMKITDWGELIILMFASIVSAPLLPTTTLN